MTDVVARQAEWRLVDLLDIFRIIKCFVASVDLRALKDAVEGLADRRRRSFTLILSGLLIHEILSNLLNNAAKYGKWIRRQYWHSLPKLPHCWALQGWALFDRWYDRLYGVVQVQS